MKIYHGTQEEVLAQMAQEHKQARIDQMNRKVCARQRKEDIEARQDETRVHFCAGRVNGKVWGC